MQAFHHHGEKDYFSDVMGLVIHTSRRYKLYSTPYKCKEIPSAKVFLSKSNTWANKLEFVFRNQDPNKVHI
jgi:hypothetical protein